MKLYNNQSKILYKILALVLCFALSLPLLVSCDKDKKETGVNGTKTSQNSSKKGEGKSKDSKDKSEKDSSSSSSDGGNSQSSGSKDSSSSKSSGNSKTGGSATTKSVVTTPGNTVAPTRAPNAPYASPVIYSTVASGRAVANSERATIDYSNANDGYIMIRHTGGVPRVKVQITKNSTYTYDLSMSGNYEVFPLTQGSGTYSVSVLENVSGSGYAYAINGLGVNASLSSSFAPFLRPNQYVNYNGSTTAVLKAAELCTGYTTDLQKLDRIYNFVINHFTYDSNKAATVQSGYLPNLNSVYAQRRGICFDYASVMTAMLRSQNIPCKLVVGYASSSYHAWINVYIRNVGWINGAIYFDGNSWKLMDPTFASSGNSSSSIMQYIGNGSNYSAQYYY